ncbi:GNAT family N-acetyltransferase [Photobacterium halotolerans]|uniref:GNAT family N-acetyltransferase n=1 Tax=Photobacterium halotolerans TaxID=265726 RepID=UPI0004216284|nr:GNAT family N-acetyltransferase [Photobacterium halotolerans]
MTDLTKTTLSFHPLEPLRFPLVNRLYKAYYPAGKAKKDEIIWIGETATSIKAAVRFQQYDDFQLMTGMLVAPQLRQQGLGLALLNACHSQLMTKPCYCFAFSHLEPLYLKAQFSVIADDALPLSLAHRIERYRSGGKALTPMQYQAS